MATKTKAQATKPQRGRSDPKDTKSHSPRKRGGPGQVTMAGRPPNFERLERFFVSQSALARALGVRRDTIHAWRQGQATRLRQSSIDRVNTVCTIAEQVASCLPREKLVGEWLLAPQIALGGDSAAAFIQTDPTAYRRVLRLIARDAQPVSVGDLSDLAALGEPDTVLTGLPESAPDPDADPEFLASLC